jgi:sulfide dehydrogenase [flavocytochrome c] flavoprotein subunit
VTAQNAMPHAYKGGTQTELLKAQLEAMPEGGTFAMVAPPNPYRCPPGPYERISMVAHYLKREQPDREDHRGRPQGEILQAGALPGRLEQALCRYGRLDRRGFRRRQRVGRPEAMTVTIDGEETKVDVCNVIPAQKAGRIAEMPA